MAIALLVSCSALPRATECKPTRSHMTPPAAFVDFLAGGSSDPGRTREQLKGANFHGNDALWVLLPQDGEIVGRLDDKIPPYRMKAGRADWEARRLDGRGEVARRPVGPDGYGDIGFQAGGVSFPERGCWEVTYSLEGQHPLRFVLNVR